MTSDIRSQAAGLETTINALEKALEAGPTHAKILARQLSQAGWSAGYADGCESERRQDLTAKRQDDALIACLAAIDEISAPIRTLLDAAIDAQMAALTTNTKEME